MHKRTDLKGVLKFTLNQLQHVSVWSPSSGSVLYDDGDYTEKFWEHFNVNFNILLKQISCASVGNKKKNSDNSKMHGTNVKI